MKQRTPSPVCSKATEFRYIYRMKPCQVKLVAVDLPKIITNKKIDQTNVKQWTPRVVIKPIKIQNEEQEFDLTNVKQCTSRVVIEPIKIQNEEQDSELKALHKGGNASSNSSSIKALSKAGFDPVVDNKYTKTQRPARRRNGSIPFRRWDEKRKNNRDDLEDSQPEPMTFVPFENVESLINKSKKKDFIRKTFYGHLKQVKNRFEKLGHENVNMGSEEEDPIAMAEEMHGSYISELEIVCVPDLPEFINVECEVEVSTTQDSSAVVQSEPQYLEIEEKLREIHGDCSSEQNTSQPSSSSSLPHENFQTDEIDGSTPEIAPSVGYEREFCNFLKNCFVKA